MISKKRLTLAFAAMILGAALAPAQPGPGGKGGPKGKGKGKGANAPEPAQLALDRLNLTGSALDKAQDVLDEHNRVTRKMLDRARQDLFNQMKPSVTEVQLLLFKEYVAIAPQGGPGGGGRAVTSNDLVDHVMAFDKNKTGKVSKEDLPERMQYMIEKGDLNKDGYLDRDEVLVLTLKSGQQGVGKGKGKGKGPGGPGPGGFGGGPGGGGPGQVRAFTAADADRALTRLQLTGEPQEKARQAIDTYREVSRKLTEERRADLITRMKEVLTEDQQKRFSETLQSRS
jgi:Spy/CpxP family protein refolding chaperone